jgi:hypothetical protein
MTGKMTVELVLGIRDDNGVIARLQYVFGQDL